MKKIIIKYLQSLIITISSIMFFLLLFNFIAKAQQNSSSLNIKDSIPTDSSALPIFTKPFSNIFVFKGDEYETIDTNYFNFNQWHPVTKHFPVMQTLGNIGLPVKPYLDIFELQKDFVIRATPLQYYCFDLNDITRYKLFKPYSDLMLITGSKREQNFEIIHAQPLNKYLSFNLDYRIIHEPGYYLNQGASIRNFFTLLHFESKSKFYSFDFYHLRNKIKNLENGGIADDSLFIYGDMLDKSVSPVNISTNQIRNNRYQETGIGFIQRLIKTESNKNIIDTIKTKNYIIEKDASYWFHRFDYKKTVLIYEDNYPLSGFYPNIFINPLSTYDSTLIHKINNEVGYQHNQLKLYSYNFRTTTSIGNENFSFYQNRKLAAINQFYMAGMIKTDSLLGVETQLSGKYYFNGYAQGNGILQLFVEKDFFNNTTNKTTVLLTTSWNVNKPSYWLNDYFSNHYQWNNSFLSVKQFIFKGNINYKKFWLEPQYTKIKNFVYFDFFAQPTQIDDYIDIVAASIVKKTNWKKIGFESKIWYQKSLTQSVIRFPDWAFYQSIYYQNQIFKKALKLQVGASCFYYTNYFPYTYTPAIQAFYLQNNTQIGNYPYVDVFGNFNIKRANLFVAVTHTNAGLTGYKYFGSPNYPNSPRILKFGVRWKFFE